MNKFYGSGFGMHCALSEIGQMIIDPKRYKTEEKANDNASF